MSHNSFCTVCPFCGLPISCDNVWLNKKVECFGCGKSFTAKQKEFCNDEKYKILNQIMKKSEFIGQWEIYLNQFADRQNPKYQYWQEKYKDLKKERQELYNKLLDMMNVKRFK